QQIDLEHVMSKFGDIESDLTIINYKTKRAAVYYKTEEGFKNSEGFVDDSIGTTIPDKPHSSQQAASSIFYRVTYIANKNITSDEVCAYFDQEKPDLCVESVSVNHTKLSISIYIP